MSAPAASEMKLEDLEAHLNSLKQMFIEKQNDGWHGAKRGGTREQCSQELVELADIFRKIIKMFMNYK